MAAQLSRLLTASTVVLLLALLVLLIADGLSPANLRGWRTPVVWALAVLILVRLATHRGSWRRRIAAPLAGTASFQSRLFGFTPGSSASEPSGAPAYTISKVEDEEDSRRSRDGTCG
ncbi:hypothetical protein ITX31_01080 [Arthrobacter gandavensis]|uniref:hypothetical protein n=1 Tax=Arthrobacter gandavensis TaxID=169960 RepID=UPI00188FCDC8|nr:hypothetical protein [Arthrobacter gandavensis]MBF4992705.1 hypothetical protein [Arthrobacter gandavensis]